ncbi:hypothetical protein OJ998_17700 [Solirubrobacter taibaiensis]|nr:hypothetical protein [Solirubrobacter taibaiensis]
MCERVCDGIREPATLSPVRSLFATLVLVTLLAGCGAGDDWSTPHSRPVALGTLGSGFVDPAKPPAPESVITPEPGSWDAVHPSKGYRVVLLTSGEDKATEAAVSEWADAEDASLKTVTASEPAQHVPGIVTAMDMKPDLIIATGPSLVEPLDLVTASHLNQQFLFLGGRLGEPTANVTAATFAPRQAAPAVRAGVAAVLTGWTGIVVDLG